MLFNSIQFAVFLPIVFLLYWFVFDRFISNSKYQLQLQNIFIVVSSYVFYGWWDWRFLLLIAFTSFCSWGSGLLIGKAKTKNRAKTWMWLNIILNLGILALFKYYDFFVVEFAQLFHLSTEGLLIKVILPVGISFYTFQALSYSIDIYREKIEPTKDIVAFFAFISFFPQLVAGPIERATNLLPQFQKKREFDYDTAVDGMRQILWGLFKKLLIANNLVMWRTLGKTAAGQIESYVTGDGLVTTRRYDPETGRLREILTLNGNDTIQYNSYGYDLIANLAARIDHVHGMNEEFIYDRLNRLTGIVEGNDTTARFAYDAYGRMLSKRIHSATVFDDASYNADGRPHAIAQASTAEDLPMQYMSYTHFDKLSRLRQDTLALDYTYGFEHQRLHMTEATIYGDTLREKEYAGNCEFIDNGLCTTTLTYLTGPLGVFGSCQIVDGGRPNLFFVHPDHLGSWNLVTDRYANIVQDVTFDAWGTPFQFGANGLEPADTLLFDRGFTGHEHLSYFGLINMNGRMYDPFTSGFLSVDNYVQNPDYTQCFNRYSYCFNNPLKYTDPDGENPLLFIAKAYFLFFTETGYELQKYLNFAAFHFDVHLSTEQMGIGFDVSVGVPKAAYLSYRAHFGSTYYWKHYDNSFKGLEMRYGGEWTAFSVLNYSGTAFKSGETSQTTKAITLGGPYANIRYENDYMFDLGKYFPGVPDDDHGDRYRTAAARIKLGAATVGVNLFTGDPGHYWDDRKVFNGPDYNNRDTYVINDAGDNPDQYRSGVFYVGLGSIKLGWNSEGIRHCFQNIVAHDWIDQGGSPYFKVLNIRPRFYIYFGTSTGNTLW